MTLPGFPDPPDRRAGRGRARRRDESEDRGRSIDAYDDFTGSRASGRTDRADDRHGTTDRRTADDRRTTSRIDDGTHDRRLPHPRPPVGGPPPGPGNPNGSNPNGRNPAGDEPIPQKPRVTVTRVAANRARALSRETVRRIGEASRAGGAGESGLTKVIWMNVVQTGGDGMIAVALANTIFFSAATSQQRGNVALYLAITMAPFALIAPFIGPLLDRLQRGRRMALAGTMLIRGLLAWIMAANFHNVGLYPAVFGFLVVSKAFNVLKGAVVPRVLPDSMTLVSGNARLSIFGLAGGACFGAFGGLVIKLTSTSAWTLRLAVIVFIVAAVLSLKLPPHVDSSEGEMQADVLRSGDRDAGDKKSRRSLGVHVVTALRGASALRGLSGFLTLFLAFLIQHHYHGWEAAVALGALAAGAGGGGFLGTAAGARLKLGRPDVIVLVCVSAATAACIICAIAYSIAVAVAGTLIAGIANSLAKLSLDAIIQREVPDWLRASAFGRSETVLQLAWVIGGAIGIALPPNGRIGFAVAAAVLGSALAVTLVSSRRSDHTGGTGLSRVDRLTPSRQPVGDAGRAAPAPEGT